jgi:hypothetical protein
VKAGSGARSTAVLHDDAGRENGLWPRAGPSRHPGGSFGQAVYEMGVKQGWIIFSMKNDWKRIFAFEWLRLGF